MSVHPRRQLTPTLERPSLKLQRLRTTHTPSVNIALPKAFGTTKNKAAGGVIDLRTFQGGADASTPSSSTAQGQGQGQKRKKGANANAAGQAGPSKKAGNGFPSAYTFASTEEDAARAKRAKRFEREAALEQQKTSTGPHFTPRGDVDMDAEHHHPGALDVTDGGGGKKISLAQMGVRAQGGKRKWLGSRLGIEDLAAPDPVRNGVAGRFGAPG